MSSIANDIYNAACVWKPAVKVETEAGSNINFLVEDTPVRTIRFYAATVILGTTCISTMTMAFVATPLPSIAGVLVVGFVAIAILLAPTAHRLNQDAIIIYINQKTIPTKVLSYLTQTPSVLEKLIKKNLETDLQKTDHKGKSLLDMAKGISNIQDHVAVLKVLIDTFARQKTFNADLFVKLAKVCKDSAPIAYIFEKGLIKTTDLTKEQQHEVLSALCHDEKSLCLLINNGFDINAKNANGQTVLLKVILDEDKMFAEEMLAQKVVGQPLKTPLRIPILLKWGAKIPSANLKVNASTTFMEWLESHKKTKIIRFFMHTTRTHKQPKQSDEPFSVHLWNFLKPAITNSVTYTSYPATRVTMAAALVFSTFQFTSMIPIMIGAGIAILIEGGRVTKALNELAIQRFKNDFFHSSQTSEYIVKQPSLLQQIIDSPEDLTKPDLEGNTLLDAVLNLQDSYGRKFDVFCKLVNRLNPSIQNQEKFSYLLAIANQTDLRYLEYVVNKGWLNNCSIQDMIHLVCNLKNPEAVSIFTKVGFGINRRGNNDITPLLYLLYQNGPVEKSLLGAFLKAGADKTAEAILDGEEISVRSYLHEKNPPAEIRALLE